MQLPQTISQGTEAQNLGRGDVGDSEDYGFEEDCLGIGVEIFTDEKDGRVVPWRRCSSHLLAGSVECRLGCDVPRVAEDGRKDLLKQLRWQVEFVFRSSDWESGREGGLTRARFVETLGKQDTCRREQQDY